MSRYFITFILALCYFVNCFAQEGLKPLNANINYFYGDLQSSYKTNRNVSAAKTTSNSVSLQLPFLDDFSYSPTQKYPDQNLWSDSLVYVNSGFAIAPISIGVATFDGLNKHGYPYEPALSNLTVSRPADTLTSKPINLFTVGTVTLQPIVDSVALSFYYQARGNGDNPELNDSLVLDFFKPNQNAWEKRVWFTKGNSNPNTNDTVFKRAFVWVADDVIDTAYLQDGFKFRFRNSASTGGSFDHWHIDYVYLNRNRTRVDTVYNDQTIELVPHTFLKNYSAMPWQQFLISDTAARTSVRIKNNFTETVNMNYNYLVFNDNHNLLLNAYPSGNSGQVPPYKPNGCSTDANMANPKTYTFTPPFLDSADFTIKHFIYRELSGGGGGSSVDFIPQNDTVIQYQRFRNYYAFDDGSAEAGYYVNGSGGMMAVKITLNNPDTLRAVRIYFDPVGSVNTATTSYNFSLCVWNTSGNLPATLLYSSPVSQKVKYYNTGFKEFPEYGIIPKFLSPGTYFIGIKQGVATGITVGFDMNTDFHKNTYYNTGIGGWKQSEIKGALMIRPVLGKFIPPPPVGIQEFSNEKENSFLVYPNPSSDYFVIQSLKEQNIAFYQLINSLGQIVKEENINTSEYIVNTGDLNNGVYFLILKSDKAFTQQQKIIISR